jgi:RNA polymerase sigma-70 factor, ECF subfamily
VYSRHQPLAIAMPTLPSEEREILARLRAGDESAFELLFREHYERLCSAAARMLGSSAAAEELVQDVFFHLWHRRAQWALSTSLSGYLYVAVRNRALNLLRRQQLERRWSERAGGSGEAAALSSAASDADAEAELGELEAALERALAALPPRSRQAFILRREQNLSYAEIARIMGIVPKTVEVHIGTALRALRLSLGEWL